MDPFTGAILAMASLPAYDPVKYSQFEPELFLNPVIADAFEPGSIFKIVVMVSAMNEDLIKPDTICEICDGPVKIDKYLINTWDNQYRPNETMTDIIVHSDNVGMVFVGQKLGLDKFLDYFKKFGFRLRPTLICRMNKCCPLNLINSGLLLIWRLPVLARVFSHRNANASGNVPDCQRRRD